MNTSLEYGFRNTNATTIIYSTVSDSREPARFGCENLTKQRFTKKLAFETSENYRLVDWSIRPIKTQGDNTCQMWPLGTLNFGDTR